MRFLLLPVILTALLISACTSQDQDPPSDAGLASGNPGAWTATDITQARVTTAVSQIPELVSAAMSRTGVPGMAVAAVYQGEVVYADGFGVRDAKDSAPVDADTVFQLASLSKPVGATVVSRVVADGKVSWQDPVRDHLPWFRLADAYVSENVTVGDLYAHRSGLPGHAGDALEDLGFDRDTILRRLDQLPLGEFRVQYAYTNFGLTAAAEAVAAAAGTSWEELSDQMLYQPLQMSSTSSNYDDYLQAKNRAVTHVKRDGEWVPGPPRDPQPQSPAGGVSSSANDMARWLLLQLQDGSHAGKELIDPAVLQQMRLPHSLSSPAKEPAARSGMYGYGIGTETDGTGHVRWSHSGAFLLGAATAMAMIPGGEVGIVVLSNGQPTGAPEAIVASFADLVETGQVQRNWLAGYEKQFQPFYVNPSRLADRERPADPASSAPLAELAGIYANSYFGPAQVQRDGAELTMTLGPDDESFTLTHWNGNTFSYEPRGENAVGISAVRFQPGNGTMTVEHLDEYGLGTFTKR